jgi:hypothetical protein
MLLIITESRKTKLLLKNIVDYKHALIAEIDESK